MVRPKKIKVPTRQEGDPTGQTQMLQEQVDSVETPLAVQPQAPVQAPQAIPMQDVFGMPTQKPQEAGNTLGESTPMMSATDDIETLKTVLLEKFPQLLSRF